MQVLNLLPCRLPALTEAVRLLSGPWLGTGERLETVGWRLLPLLVVSSHSSQLSLASFISHSSIMAQQPLTQSWAKGEIEPGVMPSVVLPAAPHEPAIKKSFQMCGVMQQRNCHRVVRVLLDLLHPRPISFALFTAVKYTVFRHYFNHGSFISLNNPRLPTKNIKLHFFA